jgi:FAD/FMN-containing dehydrogenase
MREFYQKAAELKLMVVWGANQTVSMGGYLTERGDSARNPLLGMGTDNVLELEIVTANGEHDAFISSKPKNVITYSPPYAHIACQSFLLTLLIALTLFLAS